jgi:organic hydroperoxide reductase OsmC/OhrA
VQHEYRSQVIWTGNTGAGTATYAGYGRDHDILISGRPVIWASADAHFRGDATRHSPEDLFVAALSSCHLLSYLALCARAGITVLAYEDEAHGIMVTTADGGGRFESVVLNPVVTIAEGQDMAQAEMLHDKAHEQCYIASSCSVPVRHRVTIQSAHAVLPAV